MDAEHLHHNTPNGFVTTLTLITLWAIIIFSVILSLHYTSLPVYALSVFIIGTCQRYFEELSHQANHRNLYKTAILNDALDLFYAVPLFYTAKDTREEHYHHHLHLKEEQAKSNYSYDHLGISGKHLNQIGYKLFIFYIQPFLGTQALIEARNIITSYKKYFFNCYIYHLIAIATLFYFHEASLYVYYWLIPYFTVFCVFYYYSELFTHFGCRGDYLTRDTDNRFINWFVAPLGFCKNHSLHHITPKTPWFKYSHIKEPYIKNHQTLIQTFRSMLRLTPRLPADEMN